MVSLEGLSVTTPYSSVQWVPPDLSLVAMSCVDILQQVNHLGPTPDCSYSLQGAVGQGTAG